jgi:pimeloyl-ACP methyl ester carboxylesterase
MAFFEHHGQALHYLQRGRGEPLLLIHGLGSSGADWALQVAALEARFRVIVPDLPGSGHSDPLREPCSVEGFAASLWALCDHLRLRRISIVGFSLGGAIGLEMSLQRPDAVRRLGLINSLATYRLDHWRKWLEAVMTLTLIPLLGMQRAARLASRRLFPMPWQAFLRERAEATVSAVPADRYLGIGRALLKWSAADRLDRLKAKALIIAAEHDFTPLEEKRLLASKLGAEFVVMQGSRHGTPFDAVRATNACLLALLGDQPLPPTELCARDDAACCGPLALAGTIAEEHAATRAKAALRGRPLASGARLAGTALSASGPLAS